MNVDGYCDGCKYLSPTEEEQNRMAIKVSHRCTSLNVVVLHFGVHPHIVQHPNCPGYVHESK